MTCVDCPLGRISPIEGARQCEICEPGRASGEVVASVECASCKSTPDTLYAPAESSKCSGCVSPLEIRIGAGAASIDDCVCPEGTYLSAGTVSTSPVCTNCPEGAYCPQGTGSIEEVRGRPGYWRPDNVTAQFWQCPVSVQTVNGRNWRNWMTCYGGRHSTCAPVFSWREGTISLDGHDEPVAAAVRQTTMPLDVAPPTQFVAYMNETDPNGVTDVTLSHAISAYMAFVHDVPLGEPTPKFGEWALSLTEDDSQTSIWLSGEEWTGADLDKFADEELIAGYMSGPLCAICPPGTGRNGDFKSDSVCEPCPVDNAQNTGILLGLFILTLAVVILFVYGQIKKGAHEEHLKHEHAREMTKETKPPTPPSSDSSEDDEDAEAEDGNIDEKNEDAGDAADTGAKEGDEDGEETPVAEGKGGSEDNDDSNDNDGKTADDNDGDDNEDESDEKKKKKKKKKKAKAKRSRRGSGYVYEGDTTHFSKPDDALGKSLVHHQELQRQNGTLSGKVMSHKQILTGMSRIMMSYLQVVAVARAVPIKWPEEVIATLDVFSKVSAPSLSLVSVDCALTSDENVQATADATGADGVEPIKSVYAKFIMTMMVPLAAVIFPVIFWGLYYYFGTCCVANRRCRACCAWEDELPTARERSANVAYRGVETLKERNMVDHKKRSSERFKVTLMVIFFLFYPTIVKGVLGIFACQIFGTKQYLIADMSVECWDEEHIAFVIAGAVFAIIYVVGIPVAGCAILHHFMPGIHFDPTLPISQFNPEAGKAYERTDRAALLEMKLEATAVYGFMWEGLQQSGIAPYWEWSVIMARKTTIIVIIQLFQNFNAQYQLTLALIIMFGFNLLHVKFHPYDLFYHDRLEMLSLISSEMTLFGGLIITFLATDKENCVVSTLLCTLSPCGAVCTHTVVRQHMTYRNHSTVHTQPTHDTHPCYPHPSHRSSTQTAECDDVTASIEASSSAIGITIIFFNCLYLVYFAIGLLYHCYFIFVPARCRSKKFEGGLSAVHSQIPDGVSKVLFPTHHNYKVDHHENHRIKDHMGHHSHHTRTHRKKHKHRRHKYAPEDEHVDVEVTVEAAIAKEADNEKVVQKQLDEESSEAHRRVQERLLKKKEAKARKKASTNGGKVSQEIEMTITEGKAHHHETHEV